MKSSSRILALSAAMALLLAGWPVHAQEGDTEDEGFPSASVARLVVNQGSAWVLSADTGDWEEYQTNTPIGAKTRLSTPEESEAELQFHGGQAMLLTPGTEADIRNLTEERSSFRLRSGEILFDLPEDEFAPVRVAVPGGAVVRFSVPGKYWLTVIGGGDTRLVVRRGEGSVTAARGDFRVREGEEAVIGEDVRIGPYAGGADRSAPPPALTDAEREAGVPPAAAYELRDYGEWISTPTYGVVWRPRVVAGWSPYFYGTWSWISPFGWTWVSYEPWGWWPYHFGWWYADPSWGWVWCPYRSFVSVNLFIGRSFVHHRAVFVPANVRFIPEGRTVRWVPLRPGERFVRSGFTRGDNRLATWNRPLSRGAVLARQVEKSGTAWRDWREVRRGRNVVVRTEGQERPRTQPPARAIERRQDTKPREGRGIRQRDTRPRERVAPPAKERRIERAAPPERAVPPSKERPGERVAPPERRRPEEGDRYDRQEGLRKERIERPRPTDSGPAIPPSRIIPGRERPEIPTSGNRRETIRSEGREAARPMEYRAVERTAPPRDRAPDRVDDRGFRGGGPDRGGDDARGGGGWRGESGRGGSGGSRGR